MATYQTPNIGLNKWAETDYFKRVEINENFDKIDDKIGISSGLPSWLQKSLFEVAKQHDDYLRQIAINIKQPPFNAKGGGADDTQAIQAAIDSLGKKGGCILIPNEQFIVSNLKLQNPFIVLIGAGKASQLKLKNGSNQNLIEITGDSTLQCQIRSLSLDGNKANNTTGHCIYIRRDNYVFDNTIPLADQYDNRHTLANLTIQNAPECGIYFDPNGVNSKDCHVYDVYISECGKIGLYMGGTDCSISKVIAHHSPIGFFFEGANHRISDIKAFFTNFYNENYVLDETKPFETAGMVFKCSRAIVTNIEMQDFFGKGVSIINAQDCLFYNLHIESARNSSGDSIHALYVEGAYRTNIQAKIGWRDNYKQGKIEFKTSNRCIANINTRYDLPSLKNLGLLLIDNPTDSTLIVNGERYYDSIGLVIKSPNGNRWKVAVDNNGVLYTIKK